MTRWRGRRRSAASTLPGSCSAPVRCTNAGPRGVMCRTGLWTPTPPRSKRPGPKPFGRNPETRGKPSAAVHGNIRPDILDGGFTVSKARQTTTLSLAVLRRLRFPLDDAADSDHDVDLAARTTLAALGLAAGTLARSDADLRSRCQLFAEQAPTWALLDRPGEAPREFELDSESALHLLNQAIAGARDAGLPWEGEIELTPSPELVELVRRSQELASASGAADD